MKIEEFNKIVDYVVQKCIELKDEYVEEELEIDYICIFSQNQEEYDQFLKLTSSIGKMVYETKTGPVFKFNLPPQTIAGTPKLLKIRMPDKTRPQRGDVDFNTDYDSFKKKYFDNRRFKLVKSWDGVEMIELRDKEFDVLVYFSISPLSKKLGVYNDQFSSRIFKKL